MKKISDKEYKKILVDLLVYFDKICQDNGIKYSLIGGSLIGAIRHHGIIPWDDDIDVILMPDEYIKLKKVVAEHKSGKYCFLDSDFTDDYYLPFLKLIDTRTIVTERNMKKGSKNNGAFLDIFCYHYIPDDENKTRGKYKKIKMLNSLLCVSKNEASYKNPAKTAAAFIARKIGSKKWLELYKKAIDVNTEEKNKIMSDWPLYGYAKEVQLAKHFVDYIKCDFEGHQIMITRDYDDVLRTTFGDYMTPPPEDERKSHTIEAYWKDDKNKKGEE